MKKPAHNPADALQPHPDNAPGPFYVELGCCLTCGVPMDIAPEVFAWSVPSEAAPYDQCIVRRQPNGDDEIRRTLTAIHNSEVSCIRYRGNDQAIARLLVEAGLAEQLDHPPPPDACGLVRTIVTFEGAPEPAAGLTALEMLAQSFADHLATYTWIEGKALYPEIERRGSQVTYSWGTKDRSIDMVEFTHGETVGRWRAVAHPGSEIVRGPSFKLEAWFFSRPDLADLRWYTAEQWAAGGPWNPTVLW